MKKNFMMMAVSKKKEVKASVIGYVNDPSLDAQESRSGVRGNDLGAVAPIRVELDQH